MIGEELFRLLVFSRSFPPAVGGTSRILASLFSQFSPEELMVFTNSVDDGVGHEWPRSILDIRQLGSGPSPLFRRLLHRLRLEALEWRWIRKRTRIATRLVQGGTYTAILGVIPGPEYVMSAYMTHLATGLPLYLYYIDTTMPYPGEEKRRRRLLDQYESRWIEAAREIFVLSEGLAEDLQNRLGVRRFTILRHSLTPEMLEPLGTVKRQVGDPARILFVGNVRKYTHLRPFCLVIEAIEALAREREIRLEVFTKLTRERLVAMGLQDSAIWTTSYCGPQQILVEERNSDLILVLIDDRSPLQPLLRTVFPTKTVEAMVTGVPILVIAPEDTYTARYARSAGFAYVVSDLRKEPIQEAILRLLTDEELRSGLTEKARRTAESNHDARTVAEIFRSRISETCH